MYSNVVVTDAGIQEVINAEQSGTAPVLLTQVGLGTGQYTPSASQTELVGEFKRIDANALAGGHVGDNVIYINARDDSTDAYTLHEFGVYTQSGTLFAVCSQSVPILQKAVGSQAYLDIEFLLTGVNPDSVAFGDTNFFNPPATTSQQGVVELATNEEVAAMLDGSKAVTPSAIPAAFPNTKGETGVQKLPNGLILQWGKALIDSSGTQIIFPTAFPTKCANISAIVNGGTVAPTLFVSNFDTGKATLKSNGNGGVNVFWAAIGY